MTGALHLEGNAARGVSVGRNGQPTILLLSPHSEALMMSVSVVLSLAEDNILRMFNLIIQVLKD